MNKKLKMTAGAGIAALALVVAGGGYYNFHVSNDTPDFAIKTIQESLDEHDTKSFYRAVNVESVLDSGYEGFVNSLTDNETNLTPESKESVKNFMQMLRGPMILSLKSAIDSYIATGDLKVEENGGVVELLEKTGLNDASIRDVRDVQINDADKNEAFADLIIYQPELDEEFPLQFILTRGKDNQWQVSRMQNFQDYVEKIGQARRARLDEYLVNAGEINSRHENSIREAEQKYGMILAVGNLAQDKTRAELKALINDVFKKDWETRKQELFALKVPKGAESLQNLYMRICDLAIAAAQNYAKWMDDQNPATIKMAEEKIHQVQDLSTETAALAKHMTT